MLRTVTVAQRTFTTYYRVLSDEIDEGGTGDNLRLNQPECGYYDSRIQVGFCKLRLKITTYNGC